MVKLLSKLLLQKIPFLFEEIPFERWNNGSKRRRKFQFAVEKSINVKANNVTDSVVFIVNDIMQNLQEKPFSINIICHFYWGKHINLHLFRKWFEFAIKNS